MRTVTLAAGERLKAAQLTRKGVLPAEIVEAARGIVTRVRAEGDAALRDFARTFDGVEIENLRLPDEALDRALDNVDPTFRAALERAATQIRAFHERELTQSWFTTRADGTLLGVGESYSAKARAESSEESVKAFAASANFIEDLTITE